MLAQIFFILRYVLCVYISEKSEVLIGSMFGKIINFVSARIIIVLFLSFRKVPDQTFSKEAKKIYNSFVTNSFIMYVVY